MEEVKVSLLDAGMEACIKLDKTTENDGYGGYNIIWREGFTFDCAITFDTSMQARTAEQAGVTSLYTVTTRKNLTLEYHDVFRRVRDGKVFRVTSDGDDKYTPESATLNMRQVTAEEYILNGQISST